MDVDNIVKGNQP